MAFETPTRRAVIGGALALSASHEHLAIIFVLFGRGVLREAAGGALVVHVAQRDDVLRRGGADKNRFDSAPR
jgi:hypothetical protein